MVSLFPSPADVKAGVVDYVMNPTNVGYVTIAIVVLVVTFNLGWCVSLAPLAQSGNSARIATASASDGPDPALARFHRDISGSSAECSSPPRRGSSPRTTSSARSTTRLTTRTS